MKKKILIILANYYPDISKNLFENATKYLEKNYDLKYKKDLSLIEVPGVFEIPVTIATRIKTPIGLLVISEKPINFIIYLC